MFIIMFIPLQMLILIMQVIFVNASYYLPTVIQQPNISVPISANGYDVCRFFQIHNSSLYRMGRSNNIQMWDLTTLSRIQQNIYESNSWANNVQNIGIGPLNGNLTVTMSGTKTFNILNSQTLSVISTKTNATGSPKILAKVQVTSDQYALLYYSSTTTYLVRVFLNLSTINSISLNFLDSINSTLSKNQQVMAIWQVSTGRVQLLLKNITVGWQKLGIYAPQTNSSSMNSVALSNNGTFAIFEYDYNAKLTIYNVSSQTIISQLAFTSTIINQVFFLDSGCHLIAVAINYSNIQIYDIFTLTLQTTLSFSSISNYSVLDMTAAKLYMCLQRNIQVFSLSCPSLSQRNPLTNQCVSISNTLNSAYAISYGEEVTANLTISGFQVLTPVIQLLFIGVQMTPFAIFFLSFISFWNLCCLYSILCVNAPPYLAKAHQLIFDSIQYSIFQMFGYNPTISPLDSHKAPNSHAVNYQIVLDFPNANLQNLLTMVVVALVIVIIILFREYMLQKQSFVKKYLKFSIVQVLLGQFISFVPFCIIPFMYLDVNLQHFSQKINIVFQLSLLFFCLMSPAIFFFVIKKKKLDKYKKQNIGLQSNKVCNSYKNKNSTKLGKKQASIANCLDIQKFHELKLFIINVTIPLLIILPIYWPFFLINSIILVMGVKNAWNSKKYRINNIICSLYFPLYHFCYLIFYIFQGHQQIVHYTGIICLLILLIGGVHQLGNFLIISLRELISQIIKIVKQRKKNKDSQNQNLHKEAKKPQVQQLQKQNIGHINYQFKNNKIGDEIKLHMSSKISSQLRQKLKPTLKKPSIYSDSLKKKTNNDQNKHRYKINKKHQLKVTYIQGSQAQEDCSQKEKQQQIYQDNFSVDDHRYKFNKVDKTFNRKKVNTNNDANININVNNLPGKQQRKDKKLGLSLTKILKIKKKIHEKEVLKITFIQ